MGAVTVHGGTVIGGERPSSYRKDTSTRGRSTSCGKYLRLGVLVSGLWSLQGPSLFYAVSMLISGPLFFTGASILL